MPSSAPWLARQNAALKLRGHGVTLDLAGGRLRLRATLPPKPTDSPGCPAKQQRISTGLKFPDEAAKCLQLAEQLGRALERHRAEIEPFDWNPWLAIGSHTNKAFNSEQATTFSGLQAIRMTREWWGRQRSRGPSAEDTWKIDYQAPLTPLKEINPLKPEHLVALVQATKVGSRSRRRASHAATTVAKAIGWPEELLTQLRELGKGYSSLKSQVPRDLPTDEAIEDFIDILPKQWQWPTAVVATYGCRPHEALLFADVLDSGLLKVSDGKTGARQSLSLPAKWIDRWSLSSKSVPSFNRDRSHRDIGALMGQMFRRTECKFQPYDLRHAWAVRAIHNPKISPSLAAKSMGHSLAVHSSVYQRWFDASEMASLQSVLSSVA